MTFPSPVDGAPVLRAYQIPKTHADLRAKRIASEKWAELSFGLLGRSPDHVAGFFCGFAAKPSVFAAGGEQYGENVVRFYEHIRDTHAYVSYAIVPPQIDRSKPAHLQAIRRSMPESSRRRMPESIFPVRSNWRPAAYSPTTFT